MKKVLLTVAVAMGLTAQAQIAEVVSTTQLLKGVDSGMYYPVLNEDGSKLLYSTENYRGLKMYDFKNDVSQKLTDENRAGLHAVFSDDDTKVYYVSQTVKDRRNVRQAKAYNLATREITPISSEGKQVARPIACREGVMAAVNGAIETVVKDATAVRVEGSKLFIMRNGVEKSFSPIENSAGYLWESLSPDGTKVMFFAAGKGIIITDLDGNIVSELGNYETPVWYGNNHVVAMNAKHNGYQNISSQILILTVDGSQKQELTKPESMTMNPTTSFEAGKIVYNTIDGRLYQMNINLK